MNESDESGSYSPEVNVLIFLFFTPLYFNKKRYIKTKKKQNFYSTMRDSAISIVLVLRFVSKNYCCGSAV